MINNRINSIKHLKSSMIKIEKIIIDEERDLIRNLDKLFLELLRDNFKSEMEYIGSYLSSNLKDVSFEYMYYNIPIENPTYKRITFKLNKIINYTKKEDFNIDQRLLF